MNLRVEGVDHAMLYSAAVQSQFRFEFLPYKTSPMFRLNLLCLLTLYTCFAREPPMVTIPKQGTIMGKEYSLIRTQRIYAYLGIPYAHPPVNELRFAPPKTDPLPSWEGVRNATEYASACLQTDNDYRAQDLPILNLVSSGFAEAQDINEDCLYLNVFVPYGNAPKGGFATIIWFHPGNYTTGNPSFWNPYTIVYRQRVIVVTFAFRLNLMGFFTTGDGEAPGNFGMMDQQAALRWVKNNIKIFDGDPNNICLMGYGTGAMSIGLHMINPQSKGLFAKAISMSGSFLTPSMVKRSTNHEEVIDVISKYFTCFRTPVSALMECMRRVSPITMVRITSHINWQPIIDEGLSNSTPPFVAEPPKNYFERGDFHKVPLLTGYTNMEDVLSMDSLNENITDDNIPMFLNDIVHRDLPDINSTDSCIYNYDHILDSVMFFYNPTVPLRDADKIRKLIIDLYTEKQYGSTAFHLANYVSKYKKTYMYRFDMKPSTIGVLGNVPEWASVPHLFDLIYVWGIPYWVQLPEQEWDIRDKRTADIIMSFWTNFAKTSDPTNGSFYPIRWKPFTKDDPGVLIIDRTFNMSDQTRLNYKAFEFWNDYYPKVVTLATQCCNATDFNLARPPITGNTDIILTGLVTVTLISFAC